MLLLLQVVVRLRSVPLPSVEQRPLLVSCVLVVHRQFLPTFLVVVVVPEHRDGKLHPDHLQEVPEAVLSVGVLRSVRVRPRAQGLALKYPGRVGRQSQPPVRLPHEPTHEPAHKPEPLRDQGAV